MKNLTKTLLLTSVFATASVIAMEEYSNGENPVQQPVLSQEEFRPTAAAVLGDDGDYLNDFLRTEELTIENLVRYAYNIVYYGDDAAQQIHTALGNHANGITVEDIQDIINRVEQENKTAMEAYSNGGSEYNN